MEAEDKVGANIISILMQRYAEGISEISIDKFIEYVKQKYDYDVDSEYLMGVLSNAPIVREVVDNKIILGTKEQQEEENVDDELHDNAVEQAAKDLKNESVADALNNIEPGLSFDANKVSLNEEDLCYHLHRGAVKAKSKYVVTEVVPSKNLNESFIRCKIEGTSLYVDVPVREFVKG